MSIRKIRGSATEARRLFQDEKLGRANAKGILDPFDVGGELNLSRELETTLNGETRPITTSDLAQFRRRVGVLKTKATKNKIKGGIRAQQVIHMATPSPSMTGQQLKSLTDIDRANTEIHMAILAGANKGVLRFITNASPQSDKTRHHVHVQLMSFSAAVSAPRSKTISKSIANAKWLANEPLRFDCDCGRHTFWFRYVASTGGWNYGRTESGYPKIRNPRLLGVACKHVLRVMRELVNSRNIHGQIARMIDSDRSIVFKQKDADRIAKSQKKQNKQLSTSRSKREADKLIGAISKKMTELRVKNNNKISKRAVRRQVAYLKEKAGVSSKEASIMLRNLEKIKRDL